jgi:hypothetical protein
MRKFLAVITYLGFLLLPSLAFGQATITGVVRDASGACCPVSRSRPPATR